MMRDEEYVGKVIQAAVEEIPSQVERLTGSDQARAQLERLAHRPTMELIKGIVALAIVRPDLLAEPAQPTQSAQSAQSAQFAQSAQSAQSGLLGGLEALIHHLTDLQMDMGLFSGGDNLVSPPDSAFTINDLCLAIELLRKPECPPRVVAAAQGPLEAIAQAAVPAMLTGGIHTPNHRWEISSALVGLSLVVSSDDTGRKLRARADAWLAEHIDIQSDGLYSERSPNYSAYVSNPCLIALARRLGEPEFLSMVNRDLRAMAALMQPNGFLETVQSRRQDQFADFDPIPFLSQARLLANLYQDPDVVAFAANLSARPLVDPARHLAEYVIDPRLAQPLPPAQEGAVSSEQPRVTDFSDTKLSRVVLSGSLTSPRVAASVYAGSDFGATGRVSSGLANNPSIMDFTTAQLSVAALRISPQFFDIGPLRPQEWSRNGLNWTLHESRTSGYYQPLPSELIRADGTYPMTFEGRFCAQMAFDQRSRTDMTLLSTVQIAMHPNGFDLLVHFDGPRTPFACLLALSGPEDGCPQASSGIEILQGAQEHEGTWLAQAGQQVQVRRAGTLLRLDHQEEPTLVSCDYDPGETVTFVGGNDRIPGLPLVFSGTTSSDFRLAARFEGLSGGSEGGQL
ncbi:hypothetical protein KIM372_00930 [Bombiscardovia nodaiensis]|uniref:Heparinase n=1 Tax=Bombiscardovia nodaiensis TaxID=2932181 RepID=A0ABM8B5S3_9BIFI|nr:hypothetical protein KIM372_00930 [Bombiscardovia nodaiensis]